MGMHIESELALVMTATIDPNGMPAAATRPDPRQREQDYLATLTYYLRNHPRVRRIVFAENSGWPLDPLRAAADRHAPEHGKDVEFLSFRLNDFPRHLGKSYGEMLLLDHVFDRSRLVRSANYVAKITGRIYLLNLTALLARAPVPFQFYADLRDHPFYEWLGTGQSGRHGESRFFVTTPDFYARHFRGKYQDLNDATGPVLETLLYHTVKQTLPAGHVVPRFRTEPDFRGLAGHFANKDYGSPRERAKRAIRAAARKLTPWLWI